MKNIFVLQPLSQELRPVYSLIKEAIQSISSDINVHRADEKISGGIIIESIYAFIEQADVIICDISRTNFNVAYELGYAHGLRKPVIMIAMNSEIIPFDVRGSRIIFYDLSESGRTYRSEADFVKELQLNVKSALSNPTAFTNRPSTKPEINNVFISYSHKDSDFLKRLLVHLKPLEKEKLIDLWVDTKLEAGDRWKNQISEALDSARVAILLITADFLASDFIVDNELPPLLAKAEVKGTRIIPVILKPCRFTRDKNLGHFQAINNPDSPIVNLPVGEQEQIYDQIAQAVERSMVR